MRLLIQFSLCCVLATGAFADRHEGGHPSGGHTGAATHRVGGMHGSARTFGYGHNGYGYGGYYGGYFEPFYDSGYYPTPEPPEPNAPPMYRPAMEPAAAQPVHSVIHEYTRPEDYGASLPQESSPILYLIAFRDNTIRAAMTYWIDEGTLHYLDLDHKEQHAPVASVDRDLSARLNRERRVPFNMQ
jgi:hypothetical protein